MAVQPLVSAIVIFLNGEEYIEEAIQSVLAQSYTNWELLLVDDGSTDSSTIIALRYAAGYPGKIRYVQHADHANRGMSASRNRGITEAQGEYIAFLDADDVWLPHKLERQVLTLEQHPHAAMIYGPAQLWQSWETDPAEPGRDRLQTLHVRPETLVESPHLLPELLRNPRATPCTCSLLVRRRAVEDVGGFEEHFTGAYEDQAFYTKIFLKYVVYVSGECVSRYRIHPNSCCVLTGHRGRRSEARSAFLNWLAGYLSREGNQNPAISKCLRRQLALTRYPILLQRVHRAFAAVKNATRPITRLGLRPATTHPRGR